MSRTESAPAAIERVLRFTWQDMDLFAAGSGDRSPLHTDEAFARRSAFGTRIVYGGLLSLGMLGVLPEGTLAEVRSVRSTFPGPVLPETPCAVRVLRHPQRPDLWEARLTVRGAVAARLVTGQGATASAAGDAPEGGDVRDEFRAGPELQTLARRLGAEALHPALLHGIAWASYAVGMGMPGFHGLCAAVAVAVSTDSGSPRPRRARIVRDDNRTGERVIEAVLGGAGERTEAFARVECFAIAPATGPDPAQLGIDAEPGSAQGAVVVVGASRGFGAALTLALLARGHTVHALYARSDDQADELARIAGRHAERLVLHRVDATDAAALDAVARSLADAAQPLVGLVLNAAPPPLPMALSSESAAHLSEYVAASLELAAVPLGAFLPLLTGEGCWLLVCSAAAVVDPPRDLPQLVAAKGALEGLARWAAATAPRLRTLVLRPPSMRTGQTNTPNARLAAMPVEWVAEWVVERLADETAAPGLTVLEPTTQAVR